MSNLTEEQARKFLESKGYFTRNLWSIDDVKANLSKEQKLKVLEKALTNEATMEQIWLSIDNELQNLSNK